METNTRIESAKDFADTPQGMAQRWSAEIEASKKELEKFQEKADKITRRYLDKRDDYQEEQSRVNLFWSTTKVLLSLLYARPPRASVSRSFLDADDDQARVAGQIMQRMLNRSFDDNVSDWDASVRQGIEDWLIVGMGQLWQRYEVETVVEEIPAQTDPLTGEEIAPASTYERIVNEDAPCDYVYWKDFFWSPARTWPEVRWVARRVYMTKDQLVKRFGEEIAKIVPLASTKPKDTNDGQPGFEPEAAHRERHLEQLHAARGLHLRRGSVQRARRDQYPHHLAYTRREGGWRVRQSRRRRAAHAEPGRGESAYPGRQLGDVCRVGRREGQGRLASNRAGRQRH